MDETRALLDALMGPNRNVKAERGSSTTDFVDKTICKNFIVGFCPHDWFTLQKRQLKACTKVHSEMMKLQFEGHPDSAQYRVEYEEEFLRYLEEIARECDHFVSRERVKCRPKGTKTVRIPAEVQTRLDEKEKLYAELIKKSEEMAENNGLAASQAHMIEANTLKEDIDAIKERHTVEFPGEDICDTCGTRYPAGPWEGHDKESHKRGKTHDGFAKIRDKIEELRGKKRDWEKLKDKHKDWYRTQRKAREKDAERERELEKEREKAREKEREREREKEKEREKERARKEKEMGEREKERDKERAREKEHEKEKSKTKDKERDRDRDRDRARDRDRDKDRSRSREGRKEKDAPKRKERDDGNDKKAAAAPPPPPAVASPPAQVPADAVGAELAEKDLPAFWLHLGQLSLEGRQEALKRLNPRSSARLEEWLMARIANR